MQSSTQTLRGRAPAASWRWYAAHSGRPWLASALTQAGWARALQRLLALLTLTAASGAFAQSCTLGTVTANPNPSAIKAPTTLTAGQIFFVTTISATFSCTGSNGQAVLFLPPSLPGGAIVGPTNVSIGKAANSGVLSNVTGPCAATDQWGLMRLLFTANGTCGGTASMIVNLSATAAGSVAGTIPANMNASGYGTEKGWMSIQKCVDLVGATCGYIGGGHAARVH